MIIFDFTQVPTFSDVGCKTVANMIKGKTPEEIRKLFNIVNDFTPEEEVRVDFFPSQLFSSSLHRSINASPSLCTGPDQEGERELPASLYLTFSFSPLFSIRIRNGPRTVKRGVIL